MTLLEIQAIRALPEEYVVEGMRVVRNRDQVFAHIPKMVLIAYDPEIKSWYAVDARKPEDFHG